MTAKQLTLALGAFCFSIAACKKDSTDSTDDGDNGYASEYHSLEYSGNEAQVMMDLAASGNSVSGMYRTTGSSTPLSTCATITHDTLSSPHVLTIDFGATNCRCEDGKYRRGKVVCIYSGRYKDPLSTHTITFQGFFRNDNGITGTRRVVNSGGDSTGRVTYAVTDDINVALAGGGTRSLTSTRTRNWTAGYSTQTPADDAYSITGSGTVTRATGVKYSFNITSPLQVSTDCDWIKSGTLQFGPVAGTSATALRTLNFGNGNCDDAAVMTLANGTTRNVTLK